MRYVPPRVAFSSRPVRQRQLQAAGTKLLPVELVCMPQQPTRQDTYEVQNRHDKFGSRGGEAPEHRGYARAHDAGREIRDEEDPRGMLMLGR